MRILKLKNTMSEREKSLDRVHSIFLQTKERICKFEYNYIEIIKSEELKGKKNEK